MATLVAADELVTMGGRQMVGTSTELIASIGWAFVRHRLKDALKAKIESDEQRLGWNSEPLWSLFDKFGLLEKAVDKAVDEGEVPAADFIVEYLERAGALDDLDIQLEPEE